MQIGSGGMIYAYGFSWIVFLACLMNYELSLVEMLLLCAAAFLCERIFLHTLKHFIVTVMLALITGGILVWGLHTSMRLEETMGQIRQFFEPYYMSLNSDNPIGIDLLRQGVILLLVAILIYRILYVLMMGRTMMWVFAGVSLVLATSGFLMGRLSGARDRTGFLVIVFIWILLYLYRYYHSCEASIESDQSFGPFILLSICFGVIVLGMSQFLFLQMPRPIKMPEPKSEGTSAQVGDVRLNQEEIELFQDGIISDNFEAKGYELFQVNTDKDLYLKGTVYDHYDSGNWLWVTPYEPSPEFYMKDPTDETSDPVMVYFTKIKSNTLFAGGMGTLDLKTTETFHIGEDHLRGTFQISDDLESDERPIVYSFKTRTDYWVDEVEKIELQAEALPKNAQAWSSPYSGEGLEKVRALAREITKDSTTNYDKVVAVNQYLAQNYTYNLMPEIEGAKEADPILRFLFETKAGFCQHFASSAALLLGSIDIPVRYVTGFRVNTAVSQEEAMYLAQADLLVAPGYHLVSDNDAHAWIEVYYPQAGWMLTEMTPGFEVASPAEAAAMELESSEAEPVAEEKESLFKLAWLAWSIPVLVLALPVSIIIAVLRSRKKFNAHSPKERLIQLYGLTQAYLKVMNLERQFYETPRENALRVDYSRFFYSDTTFEDIIEIYERCIYAGGEADEASYDLFYIYYNKVQKNVRSFKGEMRCLPVRINAFMKVGKGKDNEEKLDS